MALAKKRDYKDAKVASQWPATETEPAPLEGLSRLVVLCSLMEKRAMSEFDESNLEQSGSWSADSEDNHSVAGRARVRAQLAADVEAFLNGGGKIQEVDTTLRSESPRKVEVGFNNRSL